MRLDVALVDSASGLAALRPEWNPLVESSRSNNIFLAWEWIATWWEVYGSRSRLHVLTARDSGGRLVGLAPLYRARRRVFGLWRRDTLRFIGDGGDVTPEQLDVVAAPGLDHAVANAFASELCSCRDLRAVDLRPLAADSLLPEAMRSLVIRHGGWLRCQPDAVCPVLPLPKTSEQFLAERSRNYRKKIREYERRCERDLQARVRTSTTPGELQHDMQSLVLLHRRRWNGRSRAFRSGKYLRFHERLSMQLLERGWVRLFTLESRARPVAVLYCFAYGDRYYFYQAGRDPEFAKYRVGLVIMHRAIQQAIREGATVFDFLRGDEGYKYRWATDAVTSVRVVYCRTYAAWIGATLRAALRHLAPRRGQARSFCSPSHKARFARP